MGRKLAEEHNEAVRLAQARKPDLMALIAAVLAAVMLIVYVSLMRQQDDEPLLWVVGVLACGTLLGAYGASPTLPRRRTALLVSGALLSVLGLLAILSIGLPILAAGALENSGVDRRDWQVLSSLADRRVAQSSLPRWPRSIRRP